MPESRGAGAFAGEATGRFVMSNRMHAITRLLCVIRCSKCVDNALTDNDREHDGVRVPIDTPGAQVMTLVVKIAGLRDLGRRGLLDDLTLAARSPGGVVLVHAGRDASTTADLVVVDRAKLESYARDAAAVNQRLAEALLARGVRAMGISGHDAGLVQVRRRETGRARVDGHFRPVAAPWTGTPVRADAIVLRRMLASGITPVIAPLGAGEHGEMLTVDPDQLGACLASSLGAKDYVILSNVPGLLEDVADETSVVPRVDPMRLDAVEPFARGRMLRKLHAAREAVDFGVSRVVIGDARRARPVRDALAGIGTVIEVAARRPQVMSVH